MPWRASTRISFVITLCIFLPAATLFAKKPPETRPIQIENGKLMGVVMLDQKVIAYKGIPYAQPPVEELRWRPPMPVGKWKKVLFARGLGVGNAFVGDDFLVKH